MKLLISPKVRAKLAAKQPPVSEEEIVECFSNRNSTYAIDTRADNLMNPLTRWFIAETNFGRKLKVAFVPTKDGIHIKSAYDPDADDFRMYNELSEKL